MHFDGSFTLTGGVVLTSPTGEKLQYVVQLLFKKATNNMTEYEGLLAGLQAAAFLGICCLLFKGDSQLVVNQVSKDYQCLDLQMAAYLAQVRKLERHFDGLRMQHVPRRNNALADRLSRLASLREPVPVGTLEERLTRPSSLVNDQD